MQAQEKVLASAVDGIGARRQKVIWGVQCTLYHIKSFPTHATHFLSNCFRDSLLYETEKIFSVLQWSENW